MFDLAFCGGSVVDGTGAPRRAADVALDARGNIAAVGDLASTPAAKTLDISGRVVAPGFVDLHSHSDVILALPAERRRELMRGRLLQGITTELVGNCGLGVFPTAEQTFDAVVDFHRFLIPDGARIEWQTTGEYLDFLEKQGVPLNVATLVPHNPLRMKVMGASGRAPGQHDLEGMRREVERAMSQGARGLSFGLIYFPGRFAPTEELVELARPVAEHGGIVAFHQRSGSPEVVLQAVDEIIEVGEKSGARVHLSHDHVQGRLGWRLVGEILSKQRRARERGIEFSQDVIPYTGVTTTMLALYPPWALAGGVEGFLAAASDPEERRRMQHDMESLVPSWPPWREGACATNIVRDCGWDAVFVGHVRGEANKQCEGVSATALAEARHCEPFDAITDLLLEESGDVGLRLVGISGDSEEEAPLLEFLRDPNHAIISDAWDVGRGKPHPGVYGAFPRVLGRYVRELKCLSLEEAIRKMTSLPASLLGLTDRGRIEPGFRGDLVVFDPDVIAERATYDRPRRPPRGIDYVFVNGRKVASGEGIESDTGGSVIR